MKHAANITEEAVKEGTVSKTFILHLGLGRKSSIAAKIEMKMV